MTRAKYGFTLFLAGLCFSYALGLPPVLGAESYPLTYLDSSDPFYPGLNFPKLITPQWCGETNVDAVVVLAIDDMNGPPKWEKFLRPILVRLKQINGRAPVSIMTVSIDPQDPQLQTWLSEGLSLEVHTLKHPCPLLAQRNIQPAQDTYHQCVALLNSIPGNHSVAFRMPCCDSMDSASPRFYAEIFNRTNDLGQFLTIDSSVMNILTTNDPVLPRELVQDADRRETFRKYLPFPAFTTTIENYPYPYVIGRLCWEFPAMVPSDWEAQHLHGTNNPATVADWRKALDATVIKQGVMTMIFHPHGWISSEQIVELIDYAVQRYGDRVKFLTFREVQERLDQNLLLGQPLRAANGQDNGVRLLDLNQDGYLDVIVANDQTKRTRIWNTASRAWMETGFPTPIVLPGQTGQRHETGMRFGSIHPEDHVTALIRNESLSSAWTFKQGKWVEDDCLRGLELDGKPVLTQKKFGVDGSRDRGVRFRDLNGDGQDELIVGNESQNAVFSWSEQKHAWTQLPYSLPPHTSIVDAQGRDNGLRFVDVNDDGFPDLLFSNEKHFSLHLFIAKPYLGFETGWSREVFSSRRGEFGEIPMITTNGQNNGAWFHGGQLWIQNEQTASLPDKVDRRSFDTLLAGIQPPPLSPEESLKAIHVRPGFKVELVAHEPLVKDPIAFEWGADGKLWVVEMGDYPLGVDGHGKPGGTVLFLQDTHHDGIYDKSTVFLENVNFPTGVMPWGKGVIVSAAPEIFYAEDTDGDGKADLRKVLYSGFNEGNQQHRLNGFDYGLDNWVYGANGDSGGSVTTRRDPGMKQPPGVDIGGRDFRFRLADGSFEAQPGETQFGRHRDDWGNWFGNNNSIWLWHYFLPEHYLSRNPNLAVKSNKRVLANYENSSRVYPVSHPQQRFNDIGTAGHVTSANSATPYRDQLFGKDFETSVFISEPVYNLVHREVLEPDGVSFRSRRADDETESEFLASTDNWFRPTMLKTGPDGALYLADMYRLVIEHPEWIPNDVKGRLDLRAGSDKGRIYRIYPTEAKLQPVPRLDRLGTDGLVAALDSPNGWQRDTAQRLLVELKDPAARKALEKLVRSAVGARTRLQALCTLDGLGGLNPDILATALKDPHPTVRAKAIELSEGFVGPDVATTPKQKSVPNSLATMVDDPDLGVRYQLAFTLGESSEPWAAHALAKLAERDGDNADMQVAILSSAPRHLAEMLKASLKVARQSNQAANPMLDRLFALLVDEPDNALLESALFEISRHDSTGYKPWQFVATAGILDALDRKKLTLLRLKNEGSPGIRKAVQSLDGVFAAARSACPPNGEPSDLSALRLLGRGLTEMQSDLDCLKCLLQPAFPLEVQTAALDVLRKLSGKAVGEVLVESWNGSSPMLRPKLLDALFSRTEWLNLLMDALERGTIPLPHLGAADRERLLKSRQASIRDKAARLFSATSSDRQAIVRSYNDVAGLTGDQSRGALLFQQNCAICHEVGGSARVGPDLGTVANKPTETLVESILDPNKAVEARYINYSALLQDEREVGGVIVSEGPTTITLRSPAAEETVLRKDLQRLTSSGLSLMPEGFEKILSPQDVADILAFIRKK